MMVGNVTTRGAVAMELQRWPTMAGSVIAHRVAAMAYNVEACGAVAMVGSAKVCKTVTMELQ
jgi:hypothetical protein